MRAEGVVSCTRNNEQLCVRQIPIKRYRVFQASGVAITVNDQSRRLNPLEDFWSKLLLCRMVQPEILNFFDEKRIVTDGIGETPRVVVSSLRVRLGIPGHYFRCDFWDSGFSDGVEGCTGHGEP